MRVNNAKYILSKRIVLTIFIVCFLACLSIFVYTVANASSKNPHYDYFGIGENKYNISGEVGKISNDSYQNPENFETTQTIVASYSTRDISTATSSIVYKVGERIKLIEQQKKMAEMTKINELKNKQLEFVNKHEWPSDKLPLIDYDMGHDNFVALWTDKINKYLQGFPLEGKGNIFAEQAWEKGIDPRWSPAISNTESTRGSYCFAPFNAWGWGDSGWASWEEAIPAHIDGLNEGYGFSIKEDFAKKYCPPNCKNWYDDTLEQMIQISKL